MDPYLTVIVWNTLVFPVCTDIYLSISAILLSLTPSTFIRAFVKGSERLRVAVNRAAALKGSLSIFYSPLSLMAAFNTEL